jgi:hypothetical protein
LDLRIHYFGRLMMSRLLGPGMLCKEKRNLTPQE